MIKTLSLGWGVQSFTLAAMVALGEIDQIDFAIHADTGHEMQWTYDFIARWKPWLESHGLKILTVSNPQPGEDLASGRTDIPAFTWNGTKPGQLRRQCTSNWKIQPIRRAISKELKSLGYTKTPEIVESWIGISLDERIRKMRPPFDLFVHQDRIPLADVDLRTPQEMGQINLFENECTGVCGI